MKALIYSILAGLLILIVWALYCYIMGAVIYWDISPNRWTMAGRVIFSMAVSCLAIFLPMIIKAIYQDCFKK